jgi:PAS domain S-box-containing protein
VIDDLREHEVWSRLLRERLRSLAAVPLVYGDHVLGVLHVGTETKRDLRGEVVLLELVAIRAAAAIARIQAEEEKRRDELRSRLLADFSHELSGSIENRQRALQLVAERIATTIGDSCALYLLTDDRSALEAVALHHRDIEQLALARKLVESKVGLDSDLGTVVKTGETVRRFDLSAEQFRALLTPAQRELLGDRFVVSSLITVPLRARGEVVGAVNLARTSSTAPPYTEADQVFLEELAARAGVAIDNARLYAEAHESSQRFQALFDSSRIGFAARDADGRVVETNHAYAEMLGFATADDVRGSGIEAVVSAEELENTRRAFAKLFDGATDRLEADSHYLRQDGTVLTARVSTSLVRDTAGEPRYSLSLVEDVGRQRALERQLRESQKMEALGRLAGGIAHDFNNVLMAIAGFNELIAAELAPDHPLQRETAEVRAAADRAAGLTRQLLTFSRRQVVKLRAIEPGEVVRGLASMLGPLIGEDVELALTVSDEAGAVEADRNQLEQVVINLAVNARDAMPSGGRLAIDVRPVELEGEFVPSRPSLEPGHYLAIAVSDTGHGMDAETQAHIFDPFFTTKPPDRGTGLGLSTVFGIVQQSGGSIAVYSEPGHGSTFRIYLPRTERIRESDEPQQAQPSRPVLPGAATILLIDDEDAVRRVITRLLERSGFTVLAAGDGPAALAIAQGHSGPIDVLLTDVVLPGMAGPEIAERLAAERPEMRVLYCSGYPGDEIARRGLEPGAAYLEKPFSHAALEQALSDLLVSDVVAGTRPA